MRDGYNPPIPKQPGGVADLPAWFKMKIAGGQGDNMNPGVMSQMAAQSSGPSPLDYGLSKPGVPDEPPAQFNTPAPQPVQQAPKQTKYTVQPTTSPLGTLPQENPASQPSMMGYGFSSKVPTGPMTPADNDYLKMMLLGQLAAKPTASPELDAAMKEEQRRSAQSMLRQDDALQQQKKAQLDYQNADQPIDYRPLASLVDKWAGGGNLSAAAQAMAPESDSQRKLHNSELLKDITTGTGQLTKDQLDMMKQQLTQQSYIENRRSKGDIAKMNNLTKMMVGGNKQDMAKANLNFREQKEADKQLADYTKAVNNPTTRSAVGRYLGNLDNADAALTLSNQIGMPEGMAPPQNESRADRVKRYDQADSRQVQEFVRAQDRLLTAGGVSTLQGQTELTPVTLEGLIQKYGEKGIGIPQGMKQGEFIERMLETTRRERKTNSMKLDQTIGSHKKGYPLAAKVYGDRMDEIGKSRTMTLDQYNTKDEDRAAVDWAKSNRGNPDAETILQMHGVR